MSDTEKDCNTSTKCNFKEVAIDNIISNGTNDDCDLIDHFTNMPKENRSHEDFECLLDLLRAVWHNKLWLEHELELKNLMYNQSTDANLELKNLCNRIGKQLVDQDGTKIRLNKVVEDVRNEFYSHVVDVALNGNVFTVTRKHMRQLLQWYAYDPSIYFSAGDTYLHTLENEQYVHKFGLGEIVVLNCKDSKGNVIKQEVILFRECPHIVDVVTSKELQRCDAENDVVCKPRFAWSQDIEPCTPRKYLMSKSDMINVINDVFNL